jgi:hypothetical protein
MLYPRKYYGKPLKFPEAIKEYLFKRTESGSWQQINKEEADIYLLPGTRIKRTIHNEHFPRGYTQEMTVTKAPHDMWIQTFGKHFKAIEYSSPAFKDNRHYFISDLFNGLVCIYRDKEDHISPELFEL